ncbi:MAG: hypothetical protein WC479_07115 [Candidatus Izemoplasmatales bacterium]
MSEEPKDNNFKQGVDFNTIHYVPRLKNVGFAPSPVAGNIPKWADGKNYPNVIGTTAWNDFWKEQLHYCINGYDTGGLHISGLYYDWLNFNIIDGVLGPTYPDFVDLQYDLYSAIDYCKKNGVIGIVLPKKRRAGISFVGAHLISYGMHYINGYRFLIGAGLEDYTKKARLKLYRTYNNRPSELRLNHLKKNDDEFSLGWKEGSDQGFQEIEHAHGFFYTFKDNAKKSEGEYYHDALLDEIGDFPEVVTTITSIKPAMKLGDITAGFFCCPGTGGNVLKGGIGLKSLYHNAESLGFMRFVIPGKRYYLPCVRGVKNMPDGMKVCTPNLDRLYPDLKPEQLLGCEDVVEAQRRIDNNLALALKNPDKRVYREEKQANPANIEDIFTSSGSNDFNTDLLYQRLFALESGENDKWKDFILDWVKDKDGNIEVPLQVTARAAKKDDIKELIVKIRHHPRPEIKDLDTGGVDGYNDDETQTTDSLGAVIVLRSNDTLAEKDIPQDQPKKEYPVCLYYERPARKELFWDISLKISVYYNLIKNTNIAAESDMVIKHFKLNNGKKYLSPRPKSFSSPDSKQVHDYGTKMDSYTKPRMVSLMQTGVEDNASELGPTKLVVDLIAYDKENVGTDWDSADAYGLAKIRIVDRKSKPRASNEVEEDRRFEQIEWVDDGSGNLVERVSSKAKECNEEWKKFPSIFDEIENRKQ